MGYPTDRQRYHEACRAAEALLAKAPRDPKDWLVWRRDYHRQIICNLGVPEREVERVAAVVRERLRYYTRAYCYPESHYTLRCLRAAGYTLGVISNIAPGLPLVLGELGLDRYLHFAIASDTFGAAKPDRRIFDEGLRLAIARAAETLHVGDDIGADVEGAAAAGIHPVLIDRKGSLAGRETELEERFGATRLTNLTQLLDLLGVDLWGKAPLHDIVPSR